MKNNSILYKQFLNALKDDAIRIISFDIFDTLLLRKTSSPKYTFKCMEQNSYVQKYFPTSGAFSQYRILAEKRARKVCKTKEDITFDAIYAQFSLSKKIRKKIQAIELDIEAQELIVNQELDNWINLAKQYNKQVIVISDMYLSRMQIKKIGLSKLKNYKKISEIFVSCEYGLKKATGNLFGKVFHELNVHFSEVFHIGDNYKSDYFVPKSLNIQTLHYGNKNFEQSKKYERIYLKNQIIRNQYIRELAINENPYKSLKEQFFYNLGAYSFGILIWEFSHFLHEIVKEKKLKQVNFFMREGKLFEKYFKQLFPKIETNLIFASRESTLFESHGVTDINFTHMKTFLIKDLYEMYSLPIKDKFILKYQNKTVLESKDILINEKTLWDYLQFDLENKKETILTAQKQQKKLFKEYFKQIGIVKESIMVDFGGGGTILTRVNEYIKKNKPMTSVLFYQHSKGYENLLDQNTISFFPFLDDTAFDLSKIGRSPEFIEILLNGFNGTTCRYKKKKDQVISILGNHELNEKSIFDAFDKGISSYFFFAKKYNIRVNKSQRKSLIYLLTRLIDLPSQEEAKYLGSLNHDEGKGGSDITTIVSDDKIDMLQQGIDKIYINFLSNISYKKKELPWVQGVITSKNPHYLISLYDNTENPNKKYIDKVISQLKLDESVMVYGTGELYLELKPYLEEKNIRIETLIDTRAELQSFKFDGFEVQSLEQALKNKKEVIIIIASAVFSDVIAMKIKKYIEDKSIKVKLIQ